jgi:hypothetical protein
VNKPRRGGDTGGDLTHLDGQLYSAAFASRVTVFGPGPSFLNWGDYGEDAIGDLLVIGCARKQQPADSQCRDGPGPVRGRTASDVSQIGRHFSDEACQHLWISVRTSSSARATYILGLLAKRRSNDICLLGGHALFFATGQMR